MRDLEDIQASLEEPFPILTDLDLSAVGSFRPFYPNGTRFLGGSARLRSLTLSRISILDLQDLLLSTPNLVILRLDRIRKPVSVFRDSGSFQPDEIVTVLSALTRLEQLDLHVEFGRSYPNLEYRRLPLQTRTVLPSLTELRVRGATETLESFMAQIDTPLLDHLNILFSFSASDRVILLDIPHILRFISRIPKLQEPDEAYIGFDSIESKVWINSFCSTRISRRVLRLEVLCMDPERQFPCLAQFCRSPPFSLHPLEYLCIGEGQFLREHQLNHTENTRWLELLRPFAALKNLYLTEEFAIHIAHALQELVGERVMEVLPALEKVFIDEFQPSGPVHEIIKEFVAARQLAGHPIIISRWDIKENTEQDVDNRYISHRTEATHS